MSLITNTAELKKLADIIYKGNVKLGWWDNPRSDATLINLMHSEASEAMEGLRKDLMDDHLPHHKMAVVELADCAIRCLDWLGRNNYNFESMTYKDDSVDINQLCKVIPEDMDIQEAIGTIHANLGFAHTNKKLAAEFIDMAMRLCILTIETYYPSIKPKALMLEKVTYNMNRADHKRENRKLAGGKAF